MQKNDEVIYTDESTNVLTKGETYKVATVLDNGGIQVYINTGFAGLTADRFEIVNQS